MGDVCACDATNICPKHPNLCKRYVCTASGRCEAQNKPNRITKCPDPKNNPCTRDYCQDGVCVHPPKPDGTDCGAGKRCLRGQCLAPECTPGQQCRAATCAELVLTKRATCRANGTCPSKFEVNCDDGIACTVDSCDAANNRCVNTPEDFGCKAPRICDPQAGGCRCPDDLPDQCLARCVDTQNDANFCGSCDRRCQTQAPETCGETGTCADGQCFKYSRKTTCGTSTGANDTTVEIGRCDGNGACVMSQESCFPGHLCIDGACKFPCTQDEHCVSDRWCATEFRGFCSGKQANGAPCDRPRQCASGFCTNGVCCEGDCNDNIACTADTCDSTGTCVHTADSGLCELGQTCDPQQGGCV